MRKAPRFPNASPAALAALVRGMPKAELHIHIEGSLEPEMIFSSAERNGVDIGYPHVEALRGAYDFHNLQSFLDLYHAGTRSLKTEDDFHDMARAYLSRASADRVLRAELFFDTQTHTGHGLSPDLVIKGLHRACAEAPALHGVSASLILCFLRHLSEESAFEALEQAMPHRDKIIGVGLASSELGHPPEKFTRVFAKAKQLGFHLVAHAGEEAPSSYIHSALDNLRVERVDHGVRAMGDAPLMARLARDRVPLTVCPLSNIKLKGFASLREHPILDMLEAGLSASIHSDDPAYFGGYINANFEQAFAALPLSADHAYALGRNSFESSFADASQKRLFIDELDEFFARFDPRTFPSASLSKGP